MVNFSESIISLCNYSRLLDELCLYYSRRTFNDLNKRGGKYNDSVMHQYFIVGLTESQTHNMRLRLEIGNHHPATKSSV